MAIRFKRNSERDEPEINLIPFIDILLVILIFLVLTTTYNKYREIQLQLPSANSEQIDTSSTKLELVVFENGDYQINKTDFAQNNVEGLVKYFQQLNTEFPEAVIVISADANTTHQSVLTAMEIAQLAGFQKITFTTQLDQ